MCRWNRLTQLFLVWLDGVDFSRACTMNRSICQLIKPWRRLSPPKKDSWSSWPPFTFSLILHSVRIIVILVIRILNSFAFFVKNLIACFPGVCWSAGRERPHPVDNRARLLGPRGREFATADARRTNYSHRWRPQLQVDLPTQSWQSAISLWDRS